MKDIYGDNYNYKKLIQPVGKTFDGKNIYITEHCLGIKSTLKYYPIKNSPYKPAHMFFGRCKKCGTPLLHVFNISKFEYEGKEAIDVFKLKTGK